MTPAARIAAAIGVLDAVQAGRPAEQALTRWARGARYAGSKDRVALRDHVYQALRCRRSYACLGGAETGRGLMIGLLRAAGEPPERVFTGEGHAPAPLSETENTAGRAPESAGERLDLPDWLVPLFWASLGDAAEAAAEALKARAPVMLRVNTRLKIVPQAIELLKENGIEVEHSPIAATALLVTAGARRVAGSAAYLSGAVELQDGSSQAAMAALPIPDGGKVLDFCAGGGEVLALAARGRARWYAHDVSAARMKDLAPRAARAGAEITQMAPGRSADHAPYDLVLCDVPCSGSGTWRRTPDAKWRLTPEELAGLTETQAAILEEAAGLVRPGGALAYATCSVLQAENEARIDAFLASRPGWVAGERRRWPISDQGDGFFLALLTRADK